MPPVGWGAACHDCPPQRGRAPAYRVHGVAEDELLRSDALDAVQEPLLVQEEALQPQAQALARQHAGLVQLVQLPHHCGGGRQLHGARGALLSPDPLPLLPGAGPAPGDLLTSPRLRLSPRSPIPPRVHGLPPRLLPGPRSPLTLLHSGRQAELAGPDLVNGGLQA